MKKEKIIAANNDVEVNKSSNKLLVRAKSNLLEKFARGFAIVMLAIFPLFMLNGAIYDGVFHFIPIGQASAWYNNITAVKRTTFRIATLAFVGICLALFVYYIWTNFDSPKGRWKREKPYGLTASQLFLIVFVLWSIVTAIVSEFDFHVLWVGFKEGDDNVRTEGLYHLFLYAATFILLSFWGEFSEKYIYAVGFSGFVFSIFVIMQSLGSNIFYPDGYTYYNSLFVSTLGNVDCAGGLYAMFIPLLLCACAIIKNKWKYFCLISLSLLSYALIASNVDSGLVGTLVGIAIALPFMLSTFDRILGTMQSISAICIGVGLKMFFNSSAEKSIDILVNSKVILLFAAAALLIAGSVLLKKYVKPFGIKPKKLVIIIALIEVAILIAALGFVYVHENFSNAALQDAHNILHGEFSDNAGSGRGYAWKVSWEIMKDNPIFGKGPGTYYYDYYPYIVGSSAFDMPHNDFLQIGVHSGFVGLILYIVFIAFFAYKAIKAANRCPYAILLGSAAAGYLAHSFFSFSIAIVTPIFWVIAGLLDKCIRQLPKEEGLLDKIAGKIKKNVFGKA